MTYSSKTSRAVDSASSCDAVLVINLRWRWEIPAEKYDLN